LAALSVLLIADVSHHLSLSPLHRQAGAVAFILIGASFVLLQFSSRRPLRETFKELLLGLAFLLWGSEQFIPPGPWVTAMDAAVVLIFVVDLSSSILQRLSRNDAVSNHE